LPFPSGWNLIRSFAWLPLHSGRRSRSESPNQRALLVGGISQSKKRHLDALNSVGRIGRKGYQTLQAIEIEITRPDWR
jgi:hypothetical protein